MMNEVSQDDDEASYVFIDWGYNRILQKKAAW